MAEENMLTGLGGGGGGFRTDFYNLPQGQPSANTNALTGMSNMVGLANQMTNLQRNQTGAQSDQLALAQKQVGEMRNMFGSLAMKPDLSQRDFQDAAGRLVSMGIPTDQVVNELTRISGIAAKHADDPQALVGALRGEAQQMHANTLAAGEKIGLIYGDPYTQDTGGNLLMGNRSRQTGMPTSATAIPMTMSPALKTARYGGVQNGVPYTAPNVGTYTPTGDLPNVPQAGAPAATTMQPRTMVSNAPAPVAGPTAPVSEQRRPYDPNQPAAIVGQGLPVGAVQSQQGPGVDATANAQAVANQDRARQLQEAAGRAPEIKAILTRMQAHADSFAGGPASPYLKKAGGLINQGAALAGLPPPIASQVARESFDKDAAMLAGMQSGALGGTDAAKQMASLMTPSSINTAEGVSNLAAAHWGNQDATMAKAQAWNAYRGSLPNGQADFGHFETTFNKSFSPIAFAFPYMQPGERQKIWNAMSEADRSRVQQTYDDAKSKGYLRGPASSAPALSQ